MCVRCRVFIPSMITEICMCTLLYSQRHILSAMRMNDRFLVMSIVFHSCLCSLSLSLCLKIGQVCLKRLKCFIPRQICRIYNWKRTSRPRGARKSINLLVRGELSVRNIWGHYRTLSSSTYVTFKQWPTSKRTLDTREHGCDWRSRRNCYRAIWRYYYQTPLYWGAFRELLN